MVGLLQSVGALFGVIGTLLFPVLRGWIGLTKTGLLAFSLLLICLVPCVVSIWMPGSPFDLSFLTHTNLTSQNLLQDGSLSTLSPNDTIPSLFLQESLHTVGDYSLAYFHDGLSSAGVLNPSVEAILEDYTLTIPTVTMPITAAPQIHSYLSIGLLMGGIVIARTGSVTFQTQHYTIWRMTICCLILLTLLFQVCGCLICQSHSYC